MPNRILKESICTSETINELTEAEETFFYRLLVNCDDFGRFDARPSVVRARLYPLRLDQVTNQDIEKRLDKLCQVGLIFIYEVEGKLYLQVSTWDKHQQKRAKHSKYPSPDTTCNQMISNDIKCPRESRNEKREYENTRSEKSRSACSDEIIKNHDSAAPSKKYNLHKTFEQEFGRPLSPMEIEQISKLGEKYPKDIVKEALSRAVANGVLRLRYIDGILLNWEKAGLKTLREVLDYEQRRDEIVAQKKAANGREPPLPDPNKVVQLEKKRREETVTAAVSYIQLKLGAKPPPNKAKSMAEEYGEEFVDDILKKLYGGDPP